MSPSRTVVDILKHEAVARHTKEFPFLGPLITDEILDNALPAPTTISIAVQRMDPDLMFFRGQSLYDGVYAGSLTHRGESGKRYTSVAFIFPSERPLLVRCPTRGNRLKVKDLLVKNKRLTESTHIVVAHYYLWHEDVEDWWKKGMQSPIGELRSTELELVIYLPPKNSNVTKLLRQANLCKNVRITNLLDIALYSDQDPEAKTAMNVLNNLAKHFERQVYKKGLGRKIAMSSRRGFSSNLGTTQLLAYAIAGRVMVTLRQGDSDISFVAAEDGEPRMGLQSLCGTIPAAIEMIDSATRFWKGQPFLPEEKVEQDDSVHILGT